MKNSQIDYFQIKAESLQFNLRLIVSFQIQCAALQIQNVENRISVKMLMDCTVLCVPHTVCIQVQY